MNYFLNIERDAELKPLDRNMKNKLSDMYILSLITLIRENLHNNDDKNYKIVNEENNEEMNKIAKFLIKQFISRNAISIDELEKSFYETASKAIYDLRLEFSNNKGAYNGDSI